jgi:CBS domain-containing protein
MHGITLFVFGGMAQMQEEPHSPKSEILMAVAGPVASILIGLVFLGAVYVGGQAFSESPFGAVIGYLGIINLILAAFNLIPAFPLDGGRILRAILWARGKNLRKATRISSKIGAGFGIVLIVLGVLDFIGGNFIGGIWLALIGMFLRGISQRSYQQLLMRKALEGEPIQRFMKSDPVTVEPSVKLDDLVENYIYKYHHKLYPVAHNSKLVGCVSLPQIKEYDRDQWKQHTVEEIAQECTDQNTVEADTDAVKVLSKMRKNGNSRLLVMKNGRLAGVVTLKDLLEFLSLKVDLEETG